MSSNKKFMIQNGAAITGEVTVNSQLIITDAGVVTTGAISASVATLTAPGLAALQSQVDAILGTSPASLDTLQEIVSLFQSEDGDIQTLITNNSAAITAMQSTLATGVASAAEFAALEVLVGTTALDTSASNVADALNELHTELGTLTATQSGDVTSLTTAIATAKSEAIASSSTDATTKADAAKASAEAVASTDATTKANAAQAAAEATASADATSKVSSEAALRTSADATLTSGLAAELTARASGDAASVATASADATSKADAAQAAAEATASSDATSKVATETAARIAGDTASVATASADATSKVAAQAALSVSGDAASVATASADATSKANAAQAAAIAASAAALSGGLCITYNSATGEIKIDEAETETSLLVADSNKLGTELPAYYRINIYDVNGTIVN